MVKQSSTRWGTNTRETAKQARFNIIDAALAACQHYGMRNITMDAIAIQAQVTRPTVYRYFPSHSQLLHAVIAHQLQALWVHVAKLNKGIEDHRDFLAEGLFFVVCKAQDLDEYRLLFTPEAQSILRNVLLLDEAHRDSVKAILHTALKGFNIPFPLDLDFTAELLNRMVASYVLTPSNKFKSEAELRRLFRAMVTINSENQWAVLQNNTVM